MPVSRLGQMITFAVELDADQKYSKYVWYDVKEGDTVRKIAAKRGHPELAKAIGRLNHIQNLQRKLAPRKRGTHTRGMRIIKKLRLPGTLRQQDSLSVLADDPPPVIQGGYAKYDTVDRPGGLGVSRFLGYDPIPLKIPIQWEEYTRGSGLGVERDIIKLERMAGRGKFHGAAVGAPAVLRISATDGSGKNVALVPFNYQWSPQNPSAPLWRISDIQWDDNPTRRDSGRRVRQKAVVTVTQYTPIILATRSSVERLKHRHAKAK